MTAPARAAAATSTTRTDPSAIRETVEERFGHAALVGGRHRQAAGHRLEHSERQAFPTVGGQNEDVAGGEESRHVAPPPRERHALVETRTRRPPLDLAARLVGGGGLDVEVDHASDASLADREPELPQRALDRLSLGVEDPRLRPDEHGRPHRRTTSGSAT